MNLITSKISDTTTHQKEDRIQFYPKLSRLPPSPLEEACKKENPDPPEFDPPPLEADALAEAPLDPVLTLKDEAPSIKHQFRR